jgi:hypothetical protein
MKVFAREVKVGDTLLMAGTLAHPRQFRWRVTKIERARRSMESVVFTVVRDDGQLGQFKSRQHTTVEIETP